MATFTLDTEQNITAFPSAKEAKAAKVPNAEFFASKQELAKLAAEWPTNRLVDTWNHFAGAVPFDDLKPVKKFTDRKAAINRIWAAVQRLLPDGAQPGADVAAEKPRSKKQAAKAAKRPKAKETATEAREGSKKAEVLELMRRKEGATLKQIMKTTGWQPHTVRGFVSGTLIKKLGLKVESFRSEDKERTYRIG